MPLTEKEREKIYYNLDEDGHRHFYYNEEYYPEELERYDVDTIINCCDYVSFKAWQEACRLYQEWKKEKNNDQENDRMYYSLRERTTVKWCDKCIAPPFDDPDWKNEKITDENEEDIIYDDGVPF